MDRKDVFAEVATTGNKGAIGELLVCVDLMSKGYMVFRAIHPNSPYDVIATKDDQIFRIEVKVGPESNGKRKCGTFSKNGAGMEDYDVKAYVLSMDKIVYSNHILK